MTEAEPDSNDRLVDALKRLAEAEAERDALKAECDRLKQQPAAAGNTQSDNSAAKKSHDDQRLILESSPFGVSIISQKNPDQRMFANRRMAEMFGYETIEQMLNSAAVDSYVNPEDLERLRRSGQDGNFTTEAVMERLRPDGSRWWCRLFRRPAIFEGEDVVIAWHNDITERKLAEDAVRTSEARYTAVVDGQSELITRFTPDGKFTFVNSAYCRFAGKAASEILKGSIFDDVPKEELIRLNRYFSTFSPDLPVQNIENKLQRHDGQLRDIEWTNTAYFDGQGRVTEFQSVARDVTERRRARKALELANQQAQEANAAKSSFLATMSHEIRTPLNGVLGLAQLLRDTNLNDDQRKKVDTILSSGQTLLAIINDVLDMSKIEAGGLELEETLFSLQDLVATIATPFQSLADDRGLKLRVNNEFGSAVILKGDPVRLRQILWNLLSNAIKFTTSGSVVLAIKNARDAGKHLTDARNYSLMFRVSDTGTGISAERVNSIFDAFTQEDSTITRKFGGTGLGLSIVKQLTEMMGGSIEVESELNKGTAFTVYLPFVAASSAEATQLSLGVTEDNGSSTRPMNVLVAEDNAVNAMIAKGFLEKFGHRIKHAGNGLEAVDIAAQGWADLILMDIHMPEMDGVEATITIRKTRAATDLPIIGLTAEAFSERHALFRQAGMNDVLTKPFTEQQLAKILTKYAPAVTTGAVASRPAEPMIKSTDDSDFTLLPVGDAGLLSELLAQLPAGVQATLFAEAAISLTDRMGELTRGHEEGNSDQIFQAAHTIKGTSASLFAVRVSKLAALVEEQATDRAALAALLPMMETSAQETLAWWKTFSE